MNRDIAEQELHNVCRAGDLNLFKMMVPHVRPSKIGGIMHCVCKNGSPEFISRLFATTKIIVDVNETDYRNTTALMQVCERGDILIAEILIGLGAFVNKKQSSEYPPFEVGTALLYAAKNNHIDMIKLLIKNGADVNCIDHEGHSLLFYVDDAEIIELLIKKGININRNEKLFGKYCHSSSLHRACMKGQVDVVDVYLKYGANINMLSEDSGMTPLMIACEKGHVDVVDRLLYHTSNDKHCDINVKSRDGSSAIMYASSNGNIEIFDKLIINGAFFDTRNNNGDTCLIFAACNGNINIVDRLLSLNCELDSKGFMGMTALLAACKYGKLDIVHILVEAGANTDITDYFGKKPEYYCPSIFGKK